MDMSFRFVILGAAKIAVQFCDAVRRIPGAEVVAVASKSAERAERFAQNNGVARWYDSYEEMLVREKPDCAYIAVTPHDHFRLGMLCLEHDVPVLCEKAMFMCSEEAEKFFARAREKRLFAMEALWSRFLPALNRAKRWLDEGRIGRVVMAESAIGFVAPGDPEGRYFSPKLGGGAAFDITVYGYETMSYLLGEGEVQHAEVAPAATGVDGSEIVTLRFGGVPAVLRHSFLTNLENRLVIYGEKGRIVVPEPHVNREARLWMNGEDEPEEHYTDCVTENGFVYEVEETIRCIGEGRLESVVVPHRTTIACARVFDRIVEKL